MAHCKNCLLSDKAPGISLDERGGCNLCAAYASADHDQEEKERLEREADLEKALEDCRGKGPYDCLVSLSGGKDSVYLLYKIKCEYRLNPLAFTADVNLSKIAKENIRRTIDKLKVDHLIFAPSMEFYRKFFRYLLENQSPQGAVRTVCYVCAPLYEGYELAVAAEKKIPLVLAGYSPGQPEPDRLLYEFSRTLIEKTDWTPQVLRESGLFSPAELSLFWNPLRYPRGTEFPRFLAPFHAWKYSQAQTMEKVVGLGLVSDTRHASPVHSNCPLNWLLMYSDLKNLGYNSYAPEFARLIRQGKASRTYWRMMMPVVNFMIRHQVLLGYNVRRHLKWLGLKPEQLRIKRAG